MMGEDKKIRVLFYLYFPAGGIGKYTHRLLEEMKNYNELDIEAVCLPEYQWRDNPFYRTWPRLFGISHKFPVLRKFRFLLGQFINPTRLLRHARASRADVVHFCNINHLSYPYWKSFLGSEMKVVCTAHDVRRSRGIISLPWEQYQLKRFYQRCEALSQFLNPSLR